MLDLTMNLDILKGERVMLSPINGRPSKGPQKDDCILARSIAPEQMGNRNLEGWKRPRYAWTHCHGGG